MSGVRQYPTSFALLEAESLGKVLPGVESSEEGTKYPDYRQRSGMSLHSYTNSHSESYSIPNEQPK